jgi:hypothetical protein
MMADPETVSKVAYDLALQQADRADLQLKAVCGVVSGMGLFIGYKLFALVQTVVTAINNNTTALQDIKERSNGKD